MPTTSTDEIPGTNMSSAAQTARDDPLAGVELTLEEELALGHVPIPKKVHWSYYLSYYTIILPIWGITPASWVFVVAQLFRNGFSLIRENAPWFEKVLVIWAGCEVSLESECRKRWRTNKQRSFGIKGVILPISYPPSRQTIPKVRKHGSSLNPPPPLHISPHNAPRPAPRPVFHPSTRTPRRRPPTHRRRPAPVPL